jgi:hypothetical protein
VIGKSLGIRTVAIVLVGISLAGCSSRQNAAKPPDPEVVLQSIPTADPAQVERIHDMKSWRNPYLIVRTDGVALLDSADNAEITVKTDDLLEVLARLPASNWPYGRVVAATEISARSSEQDAVAIRRNRGIVGGVLASAHIAVRWVPAA